MKKEIEDPIKEVMDWIDANSTPLTPTEARQKLYGKKPKLPFKLSLAEGAFPAVIQYKQDITASPKEMPIAFLTFASNKKKNELPLFSFSKDGKTSAVILDVESGVSMEQFLKSVEGIECIAYFSASSCIEKPRFRAVIPLSEDVPSNVFDYCKSRLHKAFCEIADIHSFETKRWFFLPSVVTGQYREANEIFIQHGKALDFYGTTGFNAADTLKMKMSKAKKKANEKKSVADDERVQYYMTTDFPLMKGNGDSASSLYTAIVTCLSHDDEESLEGVLEKARSEHWSEKELKRKIDDAKKFLNL